LGKLPAKIGPRPKSPRILTVPTPPIGDRAAADPAPAPNRSRYRKASLRASFFRIGADRLEPLREMTSNVLAEAELWPGKHKWQNSNQFLISKICGFSSYLLALSLKFRKNQSLLRKRSLRVGIWWRAHVSRGRKGNPRWRGSRYPSLAEPGAGRTGVGVPAR